MEKVLGDMDPTTWTQQYPHVANIGRPSVPIYTRRNEPRMDEVVCSRLEDIWIVKSVIQVVDNEI
jgi:hypothetical protein